MYSTKVQEQALASLYADVESQGLSTGDASSSLGSLYNSSVEYAPQYFGGSLDPTYGDAFFLDGVTFSNQSTTIATPPRHMATDFLSSPSLPVGSNTAIDNEVPHNHVHSRTGRGDTIGNQPLAPTSTIATPIQDNYSLSPTPLSSNSTGSARSTPSHNQSSASSPSSLSISTISSHTPMSPPSFSSSSSSRIGSGGWLSPLHIAAQKGHDRILRALLQHNVDPNEPDSEDRTPLVHAIIGGHEDVVRSLLFLGASIGNGHYQPSALHYAVQCRREIILRVLLNHCAREKIPLIDSCDESGRTPLHVATDMDFEMGVLMLLQAGADPRLKARRM